MRILSSVVLTLLLMGFCQIGSAQSNHLRKGKKLFVEYKYAEAITHFTKAAAQSESEESIYYLASCYRQINNHVEAEKWYAKLVANENWVQPQDYYNYGLVLKQLVKYDQALIQFKKYEDKRPGDPRSRDMIASCEYAISMRSVEPKHTVERLANINSDKDDYGLTPYGNGYIFASSREGSMGNARNMRSGQPYTDVYYVDKFGDKQFGVPKSLSAKINSAAEEGPAAFDEQRKILYYTTSIQIRTNPDLNSEGIYKLQILRTQYVNGEWTKPIGMPFNSTRYNVAHPALSKDGQTLYFSSDMPGGYGGKDLYMSVWLGDRWSEPRNLGDQVNTRGDEVFPVVHSENTIYFSSDYHPGFGGLDLFEVSRKDKNSRFENPRNLGKDINSSADDLALLIDPSMKKGYIASNRVGGSGGDDIYYVYYREDVKRVPESIEPNYIIISGKVLDKLVRIDKANKKTESVGGGIANARLELQSGGTILDSKQSSADGTYNFEIKDSAPKDYMIRTVKEGYLESRVDVKGNQLADMKETINIELIRIEIDDINFRIDRSDLKPESVAKLDEAIALMRQHPDMKLEVAGYCCPLASDDYNYDLSQRRSNAVKKYITEKAPDISPNRIEYNWYGETNLKTTDPKKYAENRRVEFKVIHQGEKFSSEAGYVTVKKGDTLFRIAKNNGTTVENLMQLNNLKSDQIRTGQKLKVR
jgi:outer membrane protein OmpA-like peptidoglycan-associated protein/tetratricopeptide (TPR) repeat protein